MGDKFVNKRITLVLLLFCSLFETGVSNPDYVIERIKIELGPQEHQLLPLIDDFGDLMIITGIALSDNLDIFVTDGKDNSIKKYNWYGQYQGKIKIPNTKFLEVHCFKNKLYTFNRLYNRNDLYIFNCKTLQLIDMKRKIFSERFVVLNYVAYDNQIVFNMLKYYNIYDMKNDTIYVNQKYPLIFTDSLLDKKEIEFLTKHLPDTNLAFYFGNIKRNFLFLKDTDDPNRFEFATINIREKIFNKAYITINRKLGYVELTPFSLQNQVGLLKKRYLFFLGYEKNNLVVNIIDLKILFPNIHFPQGDLIE